MAFSFGSYSRRRRGFLFDNVAKKLKLDDQEVATIDSGTGNVAVSGASGGGSFSSDSSAPSSPSNGDLWYDTDGDVIYAYVNDGTSNYWIDISGEGFYGVSAADATYSGTVTASTVSTGTVSATGNITGGNLTTSGTITATGNITTSGTLSAVSKSFLIPHPTKEGKQLRYASLEGPENGVYVRGKLTNENTIKLPAYWSALVNHETITVNLTPIGQHQNLFVETISQDHITVGGDNVNCFYTVYAERKDIDKLKVEE